MSTAAILGTIEGEILVSSEMPMFEQHYGLKCGDRFFKLQPSKTRPKTLLAQLNLLDNGDFSGNLNPWQVVDNTNGVGVGKDINADWTLADGHTGFIEIGRSTQKAQVRYTDPIFGASLPVIGGMDYLFSGKFASHRCQAEVIVSIFDASGKVLSKHAEPITGKHVGGLQISGYQAIDIATKMPLNASSATFVIELTSLNPDPKTPDASAVIFFTHLLFAQTSKTRDVEWTPRTNKASPLLKLLSQKSDILYSVRITPELVADASHVEIKSLNDANGPAIDRLDLDSCNDVKTIISTLDGNAINVQVFGYSDDLNVVIDGVFVENIPGDGHINKHCRVVIDKKYCDGQVHYIEIRDQSGLKTLGRDVQIFPMQLTPWSSLQEYSNPPFPSYFAPSATFRYRALQQQLTTFQQDLAKGQTDNATVARLARLPYLHQVLEGGFGRIKKFQPLDFPKVETPHVSVIVPVHNKFNVTYFCLCALLFAANKTNFEVVVVDDGSNDETLDLPTLAPNVTYCRNEVAQGFVRACNLGASHARGKYLVLLNNDTEPTVGWLDELLLAFDNFEQVGMAGSKLLYPDGRLQEAGGIVWNNGNPWNYGRLANPWDSRYCYTRQADYLSGAAVMLPRTVWDQVGGLSDEFAPAYFEDTDLCFKVRDIGLKTYFVSTSIVYHFEGISNGTDVKTTTGLKRYQEINRPKFKRKWTNSLHANGEEGKNPDLAKDRGILGRALFIDYQIPKPDIDAGSYATVQEMRLVQSLGYKVSFAPLNLAYMGHYDEDLNRLGIETIVAPFYLSIDELLEKRGGEFDVVYITRYSVAKDIIDKIRIHAPQAKILFNNCDLHFLRELRVALSDKTQESMQKALQTRSDELEVMRRVDAVLSYNEVEHAVIVSHNLGSSNIVKCPWVVESRPAEQIPSFNERNGIAFLGGYGHPPNAEAVEYFIREVMPILRKKLPNVVFNVYGSRVPKTIEQLATDDINIVGYVDTVDEVYDTNRIFVAPLLTGAGIKGKVLGALAHGIPTVLSPVAAESTGVRSGLDCVIAKNPNEWADEIARLYQNESAWNEMSINAQKFTNQYYSFKVGRELMRAAFEAVDIYRTL